MTSFSGYSADQLAIIDHLLTTTRSVRKRPDLTRPIEPAVIEECLRIALQAPTGGNVQGWRFIVVSDAAKRAQIAEAYRKGWAVYGSGQPAFTRINVREGKPDEQHKYQFKRMLRSAVHLVDHVHEVPIHILACFKGRLESEDLFTQASGYGSIIPAVWSLMLALRSRGLASALTTIHLLFEKAVATLLGIPDDVTQVVLLPVAYSIGTDFKPAERRPLQEVVYWDHWGRQREKQ